MTFDKCSRIKRSKSTARYYLFATPCEQFHTCLGMGLPGVGLHLKNVLLYCCINEHSYDCVSVGQSHWAAELAWGCFDGYAVFKKSAQPQPHHSDYKSTWVNHNHKMPLAGRWCGKGRLSAAQPVNGHMTANIRSVSVIELTLNSDLPVEEEQRRRFPYRDQTNVTGQ